MAKSKRIKLPTYDHPVSAFAGIRERLALVSMVHQKTWSSYAGLVGDYMHTVRFISKTEGWEVNFMWTDNSKHIKKASLQRYNLALAIEAARRDWVETERIITHRAIVRAGNKAA